MPISKFDRSSDAESIVSALRRDAAAIVTGLANVDEDGRGHYSTWNEEGTTGKVAASVMGLSTAHVFVGGRFGIWLEKQGQQAYHGFAVDRVADIFGNDIRKHVNRSIVTA